MSIPKFFQSTDAGAPILTANAGSLNAVLKACLINGYGSKPSAGWELVFENLTNHQLVVRSINPESDQCCYSFNDANTRHTVMNGFETWDSVNSMGVNPFNSSADQNILKRSEALINNSLPWYVISDDKSCWVLVFCEAPNYIISNFFGDYIGFNHLKKHSAILGTGSVYEGSVVGKAAFNSGYVGISPNQNTVVLGAGVVGRSFGGSSSFGNSFSSNVSLAEGDLKIFEPVKVFENKNRLAGLLPGYLFCEISQIPNGMLNYITDIAGLPNQQVIEFRYPWGGTHFLNISEW